MNDKLGNTPTGSEPESYERHLVDEDTEGHMPLRKVLPATEDDPEPEGYERHLVEEDTEAHMSLPTKPGSGEKSIEDTGMEPDGARRSRP